MADKEDFEIRKLARELAFRKTWHSSKDEMEHWESGFYWGFKFALDAKKINIVTVDPKEREEQDG